MKLLIVGGFLGSGKTSFILRLAHHMVEDLGIDNIVILENEIGEVAVDDKVLKGAGLKVEGLFAGCVCCTLAGELPSSVLQIQRELNPEWIIMETTGVAFPGSIKDNLKSTLGMDCHIVTIVDARRWKRLYNAMGHLFEFQMQDADVIVVNKADLVDKKTLEKVTEDVSAYNGKARVISACANNHVPMELFDEIITEE